MSGWRTSTENALGLIEKQLAQVTTAESLRTLEVVRDDIRAAIERGDIEYEFGDEMIARLA